MPTGYKQALVQVLYAVFRGYVPVEDVEADGHWEADGQVFEHSLTCRTILLDHVDAQKKLLADTAANNTDAGNCELGECTPLVLTALLLVLTALLCVPDCTLVCA